MKQLLTGKQMKQADTWSIKEFWNGKPDFDGACSALCSTAYHVSAKTRMRLYYVRHGK